MGGGVHFITQVHAFAVGGLLLSPIVVMVFEGQPLLSDRISWGWQLLCGVMGFLAQCFMSRGLQLEKAGPASLMRNVDVLFAFVYQAIFINSKDITVLSMIGAACIICSTAIIPLSKANKTPTSPPPTSVDTPEMTRKQQLP